MPKRKISTYHKILKEFTKVNKKLPEERKLSIQERRRIIKEQLLPQYKDVPKSSVRIRDIKFSINQIYLNLPPREICDLNYIDISSFALVEWYSLDETISQIVPDCVYVKVTAGNFGETRIFNTRNYEYGRNGVRAIVERIRPDANNSSGRYIFSGYQKLRPRKRNDGTPENYYLDFILFEIETSRTGRVTETPYGDTEQVRYTGKKSKKQTNTKKKIKNIIERKIRGLKQKRESKKRARQTLDKNIKKLTKTVQKVNKAKKPTASSQKEARKQLQAATKLLEKYLLEGKITQNQYDKALEKIFKEFNQ